MPSGIFVKLAQMQFWGTSNNPEWTGIAFNWRCCPCDCFVFTDDFGRDDSTDVGSNWSEATGQWGIEDDELVEQYSGSTGTSNAKIFCTLPVPATSGGEQYIQVDIPVDSLEDGDEYYIYPACTDTSTIGSITVRFSYTDDPPTWTTKILGGSGEDYTEYSTPVTGTPTHATLKVCADAELDLILAWVSPTVNELAAYDDVDCGTGQYAAIGHNNTGHQNRFDNFALKELRLANGTSCVNCFCMCQEFGMPGVLTATITGATGRAACLEGESWEMRIFPGPQVLTWEGGLEYVVDYETTEYLNFHLLCAEGGNPQEFHLVPKPPWNCHNSNVYKAANAALSTCDPLALYFGPYTLDFAMDCEMCYGPMEPGCVGPWELPAECVGEFWIVITV